MELRLAFIYAVIAVFVLSPAISDAAWSAVGLSALLAWVIDLLGAPGCAQRQVKGQFVFLVGGAVLTETVFAWPGIGRLMFESLAARDYNTILGVFLVSAAMVIVFNILTDLVYRLIDPRIGHKA